MTTTRLAGGELHGAVRLAADQGARHLRDLQDSTGYWWGELESNASITAEQLFLLEALNIASDSDRKGIAAELLATQGEDGGWPVWFGGPADLSITVEAWYALRLAGISADAEPMVRARDCARALGGANQTRFFTRLWLAVLGKHPWDSLPAAPLRGIRRQSPSRVTSRSRSQSRARATASSSSPVPDSASAMVASAVSHTGERHDCIRTRPSRCCRKVEKPSMARVMTGWSSGMPSACRAKME